MVRRNGYAFTGAKKYAAEKAEQWKTAAERLKLKERNKPSTPKNTQQVEELQKELNMLQENKASPMSISKREAPQTTEEGDSEEEAKAKETEAAETRKSSEKTR